MRLYPDTDAANQLNSADSAYHLYAGLQAAADNTNDPNDIVIGNFIVEPWVDFALYIEPSAQIEDCFQIYTGDSGIIAIPPTDPNPAPPSPPAVPATFSTFAKHTSAKNVYVSNSLGVDTNDGLTDSTPVATLAKGVSLVEQGKGDHILLLRGDTFPYSSSRVTIRGKGGLNSTFPTVMKPYGNTGDAIPIVQQELYIRPDAAGDADFFAIQGIKFRQLYTDRIAQTTLALRNQKAIVVQPAGVDAIQDFWVEGCTIVGYNGAMTLQGVENGTVWRNTILDCYGLESADGQNDAQHAGGIFVGKGGSFAGGGVWSITENVFDQCGGFLSGGNIIVDGVDSGVDALDKDALRTWFNHALYFSQTAGATSGNITISKNLVSRSGLAFQARNGGTLSNNVFVVNAVALEIGHKDQTATTVSATADSNLFLGTEVAYNGANAQAIRGDACQVRKANSVTFSNNIAGDHGQTGATGEAARFLKCNQGVGTSPTVTATDNSSVNWDTDWLAGGNDHIIDQDSSYTLNESGGSYSDGTNTATTLFDQALADPGGTYASYYTKVRAFSFDAWTADYHSTLYSAASAAL